MPTVSHTTATQFGCNHPSSTTSQAKFSGIKPHVCQFSGCCSHFSGTSQTNTCESNDCSPGPTVLGVLGALGLGVAGVFVGKRVLKTVFGTASTTIREFFSRLFTGKGLVEKAKTLSRQTVNAVRSNAYTQGAADGLVAGWHRAIDYFKRLIG